VLTELCFVDKGQFLSDGLLDHTIQYRGHAQWALFPVPLRYPDTAHRGWSVGSFFQLGDDPVAVRLPELRKSLDRHPVDPRCSCVGFNTTPRLHQVGAIRDRLQ
jgi:hypothetical protein